MGWRLHADRICVPTTLPLSRRRPSLEACGRSSRPSLTGKHCFLSADVCLSSVLPACGRPLLLPRAVAAFPICSAQLEPPQPDAACQLLLWLSRCIVYAVQLLTLCYLLSLCSNTRKKIKFVSGRAGQAALLEASGEDRIAAAAAAFALCCAVLCCAMLCCAAPCWAPCTTVGAECAHPACACLAAPHRAPDQGSPRSLPFPLFPCSPHAFPHCRSWDLRYCQSSMAAGPPRFQSSWPCSSCPAGGSASWQHSRRSRAVQRAQRRCRQLGSAKRQQRRAAKGRRLLSWQDRCTCTQPPCACQNPAPTWRLCRFRGLPGAAGAATSAWVHTPTAAFAAQASSCAQAVRLIRCCCRLAASVHTRISILLPVLLDARPTGRFLSSLPRRTPICFIQQLCFPRTFHNSASFVLLLFAALISRSASVFLQHIPSDAFCAKSLLLDCNNKCSM